MDGYLKQSTAATVKIGPFLDETTGKDAETALTISQADVRLSKNGGDMAQKNSASTCTHDELGYYDCPLSTTDTNAIGRLKLMVHESGALPVWHEWAVLHADVYDALFGSTALATVGAAMAIAANQDVRNVTGTIPAVTLASTQGQYAPAKAGDKMDLIDAPNATALAAIRNAVQAAGSTLATLLSRVIGTLAAGTHNPQSGDAYGRLAARGRAA